MSFSALLSSFDCNKSSDPSSKYIHRQEPLTKRQKLNDSGGREDAKNDRQEFECDPIANGPESVGSMKGPSDTLPKSAEMMLTSYKSHYCIEKVSNFLITPKTVVHPILGRITTSDTSLVPNDHLNSSNRGVIVSDVISKYTDVICADESLLSREEIRRIVCAHALQHISLTRQFVLKNTEKLAKKSSRLNQSEGKRDQGFTRPKVLFLLPTRNSCYELVNIIFSLADRETQENKVRFMEEFGPGAKRKMFPDSKPEDFKAFFRGNSDDMFRIGIKLTRKTIKLFSKFYHSDIIIASPLGLKAIIGATGKEIGDIDFLSSVELLYVDSAEALIMQNWDHSPNLVSRWKCKPLPTDYHIKLLYNTRN
ncbi:hypothetical protein H072_2790 [Dactylellina haptotyla CBS 200.50]|uniref:UTP25 NTP hydrolase-like domain-containing protein n=1 Tax=Dactylellina haptotyla (strain CBS 200.50) TaxID=1284197 RepID=S8BUQ8_DACHA|nr:hypothetical protein H072_2790 [Dactylellina haptotyla CBS 200.50]